MDSKAQKMLETKKRLRAIRQLASPVPTVTVDERLAKIIGVATGEIDPIVGRNRTSPDLMERLRAGQASRSHRNAADTAKPEPKPTDEQSDEGKKRGRRGGRDRQERGGLNRSTDVNL